jgi:hypothetical protein
MSENGMEDNFFAYLESPTAFFDLLELTLNKFDDTIYTWIKEFSHLRTTKDSAERIEA